MMIVHGSYNRLPKALLLSAMALYPVLIMFQGIDFTDFGFSASCYRFVFTNPASVYTTFFPVYLTDIFGGLVHLAWGRLGLISFKIAYVLEMYAMCCLVYAFLTRFYESKSVLISIFVSLVYINYYPYGTLNWINYNDLTALFYLAAGILIFYGLEEGQGKFLLFAGFLTGLNFFIRVSNLAGISLAAVVIIDHVVRGLRTGMVRKLVLFGSGILLGIASVFGLMLLLGHFPYYVASFRLFNEFKSLSQSHEMKSLFFTYFYDLGQSLLTATYYITLGAAVFLLAKNIKLKNRLLLMLIGVTFAFLTVTHDAGILSRFRTLYHVRWLFWQSGVVVLLLIVLLYKTYKVNDRLFAVVLIALLIEVITPLGSNRSLLNTNYGIWLALPLVISAFLENDRIGSKKLALSEHSSFFFKSTILLLIAFYALHGSLHQLYRDYPDRTQLIHPVADEYFRGVYTTRTRAASIDGLMQALKTYIKPSDYVLGHEYFSMANYITGRPPYMYNPGPMFFSFDVYDFLYHKARAEIQGFPVILSVKGRLNETWPDNVKQGLKHPDPTVDDLLNKERVIISNLKKDGKYIKVWENDFFEIWRPDVRQPGCRPGEPGRIPGVIETSDGQVLSPRG